MSTIYPLRRFCRLEVTSSKAAANAAQLPSFLGLCWVGAGSKKVVRLTFALDAFIINIVRRRRRKSARWREGK